MKSSRRKGVRFISHLLIALGGRFAGLDARCRRQQHQWIAGSNSAHMRVGAGCEKG